MAVLELKDQKGCCFTPCCSLAEREFMTIAGEVGIKKNSLRKHGRRGGERREIRALAVATSQDRPEANK